MTSSPFLFDLSATESLGVPTTPASRVPLIDIMTIDYSNDPRWRGLFAKIKAIDRGGGGNCFFFSLVACLVSLKTYPRVINRSLDLNEFLKLLPDSFDSMDLQYKNAMTLQLRQMIA